MSIGTLILRLVLAIILVLICVPVLWFCLTAFEPEVILYQARRTAANRPYCIAVSDKDRPMQYKEVMKRSDLTFGALTAHVYWGGSYGPFADTYYSLLILKNPDEIRNWSKLYLNFRSDVVPTQTSLFRKDPRSLCTPVIDFSKSVPY
jgi:ABC-type glycerol-3-phosphate transport system permease component